MKLSSFLYELAPQRIAQQPVSPRDHSKLLIVNRANEKIEHRQFFNLLDYVRAGDVLVINATKVVPARLRGKKKTGGKVDVLLVGPQGAHWKALVRGASRPTDLVFPEGLTAHMVERSGDGEWSLAFSANHLRDYLARHGEMPLPPYIKRSERIDADIDRYQTIYAQTEGAVAAPTAGFHFTPSLLGQLKAKGVIVQSIVLHVGWGTFRPVRTETVEEHRMLPEHYEISESAASELNQARKEGRRVIAVGTTAVRTLESVFHRDAGFRAGGGETNLFIYPGYKFQAVDALITNFHLPDSTPLLLACAFYGGNPENPFSLRSVYAEAIAKDYRFYSYGDAMFIQ